MTQTVRIEHGSDQAIESQFWSSARVLVLFAGVCGAGKTTLSTRLVERCRSHGGVASGTLDWDPHVPDQHRIPERAFRRDLDLAMITSPTDAEINRQIVDHSLTMIEQWKQSPANLIVVDRFVESYDHLSAEDINEVQLAMAASGFTVIQVLLAIGLETDNARAIAERMRVTKAHRPAEWWATTPGDADVFGADEAMCQANYRRYCANSRFPTAVVDTTTMDWNRIEQALVDELMCADPIANRYWTESMKMHSLNRHGYFSPSSKLGMARPGYKWFAIMPGTKNATK